MNCGVHFTLSCRVVVPRNDVERRLHVTDSGLEEGTNFPSAITKSLRNIQLKAIHKRL
jgi:hypothetical protein